MSEEKQESVAEVVARMHQYAKAHEYDHPDMNTNAQTIEEFANDLDMAISNQLGNAAKLREAALFLIENESTLFEADLSNGELELLHQIVYKARAAFAAPARNCDVGTAEEQHRRHEAFCDAMRNGISGYHCDDAPRCVFCFIKWAQMPYEEGGKHD